MVYLRSNKIKTCKQEIKLKLQYVLTLLLHKALTCSSSTTNKNQEFQNSGIKHKAHMLVTAPHCLSLLGVSCPRAPQDTTSSTTGDTHVTG